MAGIASAAGVSQVQHTGHRVLVRFAVLTGLVIGGWLVGSATGWADENQPHEDSARHGADIVGLAQSSAPDVTVDRIEAGADGLSTVQRAEPPVQPPVLDTIAEPIGDPAPQPVVTSVLRKAIAPKVPSQTMVPRTVVLTIVVAERPDSRSPVRTVTPPEALDPVSPRAPAEDAAPAEPASGVMSGPSTPLPAAPPLGAPPPGAPHPPAAAVDELPGWSAGSAPSTVPNPLGLVSTSCPAGSAVASGTVKNVPAVILINGCPGTDLAIGQHPRSRCATGLPGAPDQQPSTSPD